MNVLCVTIAAVVLSAIPLPLNCNKPTPRERANVLRALHVCANPYTNCDVDAIDQAAEWYRCGDTGMLGPILAAGKEADAHRAEAVGGLLNDLLYYDPITCLLAIGRRPRVEHRNLLSLAISADGGGGPPDQMAYIRRELLDLSKRGTTRIRRLALLGLEEFDAFARIQAEQ